MLNIRGLRTRTGCTEEFTIGTGFSGLSYNWSLCLRAANQVCSPHHTLYNIENLVLKNGISAALALRVNSRKGRRSMCW